MYFQICTFAVVVDPCDKRNITILCTMKSYHQQNMITAGGKYSVYSFYACLYCVTSYLQSTRTFFNYLESAYNRHNCIHSDVQLTIKLQNTYNNKKKRIKTASKHTKRKPNITIYVCITLKVLFKCATYLCRCRHDDDHNILCFMWVRITPTNSELYS